MSEYNCTFDEGQAFNVAFDQGENFNVDFGVEIPTSNYTGAYSVTPSADVQTLPTQNKLLGANINIAPIPPNYGLITYNGSDITVS